MLKTVKDVDVENKRVVLRVDFNIVLDGDKPEQNGDFRIKQTLPTIKYLLEKKAKIIIISHRGRPKGKRESTLSLKPIAGYLGEMVASRVIFISDHTNDEAKQEVKNMKSGEIIMFENLRFYPGEEADDKKFAKELADFGDVFINDAFSASHRKHASIVGIPKFLPSATGFLLEREARILENLLKNPERPLVAIIGGGKISTKIKLIRKFLNFADHLILGGALVNTVLQAKGMAIGQSLTEEKMIKEVKELELTNPKLHIPVDVLVSKDKTGKSGSRETSAGKVMEKEIISDVGPESNNLFANIIKEGKTIIWNGPMGIAEVEEFVEGTRRVAQAIVESEAYSVVGGGDTISVINKMGFAEKINYISTGGGAMLEFLTEGTLPGIEALK